jgi:MtN3 and saliva related transmembrane protein
MVSPILAVCASSWAVVMGLAPLLQLRRILRLRVSDDVSAGALALLIPGFALWIAYGAASSSLVLVIPNSVAVVVSSSTLAAVIHFRTSR